MCMYVDEIEEIRNYPINIQNSKIGKQDMLGPIYKHI